MTTSPTSPGAGHRPETADRTGAGRRPVDRRRGPATRRRPLVQLELPLVDDRAAADHPAAPSTGGEPGPSAPDWRLDEETRRAGRVGVAAARAILAATARAA